MENQKLKYLIQTVKEKGTLLDVNKVCISYVVRKNKTRLNGVKMNFPWANDIVSNINIYQAGEGLLVSYNQYKDMKLLTSKKILLNPALKQTRLNLLGAIEIGEEPIYMASYKLINNDIFLMRATDTQIKNLSRFKSDKNQISKQQYINLKKYITLNDNECFKAHMVLDTKCYIEIEKVNKSEKICSLKEAYKKCGGITAATDITYKCTPLNSHNIHTIRIPSPFMNNGNITALDGLLIWAKDENHLIIESNPIICDCCGGKISRYLDDANKYHVCNTTKDTMDKIQNKMMSLNGTSAEKLSDIKNILTDISSSNVLIAKLQEATNKINNLK